LFDVATNYSPIFLAAQNNHDITLNRLQIWAGLNYPTDYFIKNTSPIEAMKIIIFFIRFAAILARPSKAKI
jgi:hypothetical protein